jgi:SsrA-binding protein
MGRLYWRGAIKSAPAKLPEKESMSTASNSSFRPPAKAKPAVSTAPIAENRRARYDYFIEERHEAGIVLEGWEVKSIRAGQVQLTDGYVMIKGGEMYLIGCRINPLRNASTHISPLADRIKKLLLSAQDIRRLIGKIEQKGFTLVPLNLHFKGSFVKVEIGLAKGKAEHDKRNTEKKRDWEKEKGQLMRHASKSNT